MIEPPVVVTEAVVAVECLLVTDADMVEQEIVSRLCRSTVSRVAASRASSETWIRLKGPQGRSVFLPYRIEQTGSRYGKK